jgi:hypothetical protein
MNDDDKKLKDKIVFDVHPKLSEDFSRKTLEQNDYPKDANKQGHYYIVYKVEENKDEDICSSWRQRGAW